MLLLDFSASPYGMRPKIALAEKGVTYWNIFQDRFDAKNLDEQCKQQRIKQRLIM